MDRVKAVAVVQKTSQDGEQYIELCCSFSLRIADNWNQVVRSSLESSIKYCDPNCEIQMLEDKMLMIFNFRPSLKELVEKLKLWDFKIVKDLNYKEIDRIQGLGKRDNEHFYYYKPEIIALEIKDYIRFGKEFKLYEDLMKGGNEKPLLVGMILERTLKNFSFKGKDFCFMSLSKFCTYLEKINRIIPQVPLNFKGIGYEEFLFTHREEWLSKEYEIVYKTQDIQKKSVGSDISVFGEKWSVVNGVRLYELIYKFGSRNSKAFFRFNGFFVLKAFKSNLVLFVREKKLFELDDGYLINFSKLRKTSF